MTLTAAVLSGFAAALIAPGVCRLARGASGWILALLPLTLAIYFASHASQIASGHVRLEQLAWAPALELFLTLRLDGLGLLFALLISGIGTLIFIYGGGYLHGHAHITRLFVLLLLFMGSMLGIVLADNLVVLYVFWELTTITSYLLIGFDHENPIARKSAWQSLVVTGTGGLALMAGMILLAEAAGGVYSISELLTRGEMIQGSALYQPALVLILIGAFAKSAQFPFHFWLPNAMTAPTPVSAYLHSATMVKAGIYLMARLSPAIAGTELWHAIVIPAGAVTMLVGGYLALNKTDLKQVLAYSTVSALGTITLLLGIGTPESVQAAMVFLMAHAMYKGALFMVAGAVDHETGTRNVELVGGLRRAMPITATAALLAALSLAGFGPVLSFIGKEMLFEAVLHSEQMTMLVPVVVLGGALFVAVAGIVALRPFFGAFRSPGHAHEPPPSMWLGPMLLAIGGFVLGTLPGTGATQVLSPAVQSINADATGLKLALWHGPNTALLMSAVSLAVGVLLYLSWTLLRRGMNTLRFVLEWGSARWYELIMASINGVAQVQTRLLQSGYLPRYVLLTLLFSTGLIGYTFFTRNGFHLTFAFDAIRFYEWVLVSVMLLAAIMATLTRSRMTAIASLGVVGFGVALIFVLYGAPDLAMTQLLIETLGVILFVLVFYHLPAFSAESTAGRRVRDLVISLLVGATVTTLILAIGNVPTDMSLVDYYAQHSYVSAHGRNVVNVILVDFRGIDTMGEITVLAIAGVGIYALLRLRPRRGGDSGGERR
jgi:multicomponent Na+:H+ antiporter subunit A